jgi:2-succinyl-6-hydroxy-2,4-cyclohexadiene-1-carboxylate synthase
MPRVLVNDVHYHSEQRGDGAPLVLLHGFSGGAASWREHAAYFAQRFRVITVDLPGHGQTDSPADPARYRMEACVADLDALFGVWGIERARVLGYSMGGRVALHFAAAHPARVRALILESASPGIADAAERAARVQSDNDLADFIEREGIEAFVNRWEALPLFASQARLPEATRAALRAQRLRNDPRGLARSLRGLGTGIQSPLWERLPEISTPTLLLAGEDDTKYVTIARAMARSLPDAQLTVVPGAGHAVHIEQPTRFRERVSGFFESRE